MAQAKAKAKITEVVAPKIDARPKRIPPHSLQLKEGVVTEYVVEVSNDITPDDLLNPEIWANEASKMRKDMMVWVWPKNRAWRARYFVMFADHNTVRVEQDFFAESAGIKSGDLDKSDFYIDQTDADGWRVRRKSDHTVVSKNHDSDTRALQWIISHMQEAA